MNSEAAMPDNPPKDVRALLADAIRKRDELNTFIKVLQEMGTVAAPESATDEAAKPAKTAREATDPMSVLYPGMFFGKSQAQAARALLERVHRPLKTRVIAECFEEGGFKLTSKNAVTNLWKTLSRNPETFVLVPKAGWGLVDWYDPNVIAKMRKDSDEKGSEENGDEK
jgi:hypothetical protein